MSPAARRSKPPLDRTLTPAAYRDIVVAETTEKTLLAQVRRLARSFGWDCYHTRWSVGSEPGFPDLVLCHPDRRLTLFRELKTQKGRLTPDQTRWIDNLTACGFDAGVWRPSDLHDDTITRTLAPRSHTA